jgi:hypothetical protein
MRKQAFTLLRLQVFDELPEYSATLPTALPVGKRWKAWRDGMWLLAEVVRHSSRLVRGQKAEIVANIKWTRIGILTNDYLTATPFPYREIT